MQWFTLLSTLLGTTIGVASTLIAERFRSRDARRQHRETARVEIYLGFLQAMNESAEALRSLASRVDRLTPEELEESNRQVFQGSRLYVMRERVILFAPNSVAAAMNEVFNSLLTMREATAQRRGRHSPEFLARIGEYADAVQILRVEMRRDIGAAPLQDDIDWAPRG
ncbi:hypothetical protein AB0B50_03520 [Streptomyces sp. NPDC041068]|uniref:hypothetical protein n=1 Tax=Streptomyces sp. NPDC041068 TaxID=3155130 RepID=UPI0033F26551